MKNIKIDGDTAVLLVNPKIYPIEVVYSAAYVFLDKAYIVLDGDPEKEIAVRIRSKKGADSEGIGHEFFNELINYADYRERAKETKAIRKALLQRALFTNDPGLIQNTTGAEDDAEFEKLMKELEDGDDAFDDPEGIAIPWEKKYGKKAEMNNKDGTKNKTE